MLTATDDVVEIAIAAGAQLETARLEMAGKQTNWFASIPCGGSKIPKILEAARGPDAIVNDVRLKLHLSIDIVHGEKG